jgi:hypothetical protein
MGRKNFACSTPALASERPRRKASQFMICDEADVAGQELNKQAAQIASGRSKQAVMRTGRESL